MSHVKMDTIKDRNSMDLTEAEDMKKSWQEYTEELYKKDLHDPDDHDGMITHLMNDSCRPQPTLASAGDSWTLRQVWVSLLWGHCSFLLGPGVHKVLFVPSKSLFPQSCVSSGSSMVG